MILKIHHKKAARYYLVGMTPTQISKQLPEFSIRQIKLWRQDLEFKKYMAHLETKYMELIDNDINHLRRTATARLQEIVDIPYTSKNFEYRHFEWAVNKIFQITLLRDRTLNINQALDMREAKPAETPEQKNALKELMRVMGDNTQRYGQSGKLGEA